MAFCMKCGQKINENDVFCPNCGAKIERKETQSQFQDQAKDVLNNIKNTASNYVQNDSSGFIQKSTGQVNFIGLVGCALILISCFLPFASVSAFGYSQSISLMSDGKDGIIFLVLVAITAVTIFLRKDTIALVAGIITGGLGIYEIFNTISSLGAYSSFVTKGMGFYLLLVGSIVLLAGVILKKFVMK